MKENQTIYTFLPFEGVKRYCLSSKLYNTPEILINSVGAAFVSSMKEAVSMQKGIISNMYTC